MRTRLSKRKKLRRRRSGNLQPEQESSSLTGAQSATSTPLFLHRRQGDNKAANLVQRQSSDEQQDLTQKPSSGRATDAFGEQADPVTDQVMPQPSKATQAQSATPAYLQRMCSECEEEEPQQSAQPGPLQAKSKNSPTAPSSRVANTIAAPAAGKAMPNTVSKKIESVLGRNMRQVRVHDDASANQAAESLNARAFTHQNHIYLGENESPGDLPLMAHEATHVLQQRGGLDLLQNKRKSETTTSTDAYLQRQADAGVADADAGVADADTGPRDAGADLPAGLADVPTGPNACPTTEEEQEKNRFRSKFFFIERFRPSAGYGLFDASYLPWASLMTVVSKMKFNFRMARNTPDIYTLATMLANGQDISIFFWTEAQKRQYKKDYVNRVAQRWSFQHSFKSQKPCWPFIAMPYITPQVVDNDSDAHFLVNAFRDAGQSNFSARNPGTAGWQGTGNVDFYDVDEDPDRRSRAVARSERQRLERAINTASASPILFAQGTAALDGASKTRLKTLAEIMKLKNPSDPAIPIILHGYASAEGRPSTNARLAHKRVLTVAAVLRAQGIPQPMVITSHGAVGAPFDANNRKVELKPSTSFETTYSSNRFGAAEHEFGHAIGLPDEYANYAAGTNLGDKQQAFVNLANQAGVAPPDQWGNSTSSMMASGVDVLPRHYLTIWEALGAMTDPHITRDEWKID